MDYRAKLKALGWEFDEHGAELVKVLKEEYQRCHDPEARRFMEEWLATLGHHLGQTVSRPS
jgi:hypothetical protein